MEELNIYTKRMPCGDWCCNTHFVIEKAFVSDDISVVADMRDWLTENDCTLKLVWHPPVVHPLNKKLPQPQIVSRSSRLDKGMI